MVTFPASTTMWINTAQLIAVLLLCVSWSQALEKDIEVSCTDPQATKISDGGVIANCAFYGLTRTSTINPWLFQLANVLQTVNASHNHIKRVVTFPLLPRVLTVTLSHNSIREIEQRAFSGLDNLQSLDLSYNRITGESLKGVLVGKKSSDRIEPLPVRILFLSQNDISTIEPEVFEHLRYLRDLHLDYNPLVIDENFTKALKHLTDLKLLNLAGAGLTSLPKDTFSGVQITSLLLNGNHFTQVPDLTALSTSLRLLNINQNPIDELDKDSFSKLQSVSEIVVTGMPELRAVRAGTFTTLENIRVISCSYNPKLVEIDENAFWNHNTTQHSNLQEVYLNNNALPMVKENILPWMKIKKVTLDGNRWMCDCRLHWLATFLRNTHTTISRITDIKCWEPIWLNGTQLVFWNIDLKSRHENYPCEAELKRQQEEEERARQQKEKETDQMKAIAEKPTEEEENVTESGIKMTHLLIVLVVIIFVILIVSIIALKKYRNYRPIYHVDKVSSNHNEMHSLKGTTAERTQLVP